MRVNLIRKFMLANIPKNQRIKFNSTQAATDKITETSNRLRKIDIEKDLDSLPKAQQMYIKKMIEKNNERYEKEKNVRTHYRISAAVLFTLVFSIYFYSMYAVKQEKFLDDFEAPVPPDPTVKNLKK